jgi:hypothetical protein
MASYESRGGGAICGLIPSGHNHGFQAMVLNHGVQVVSPERVLILYVAHTIYPHACFI